MVILLLYVDYIDALCSRRGAKPKVVQTSCSNCSRTGRVRRGFNGTLAINLHDLRTKEWDVDVTDAQVIRYRAAEAEMHEDTALARDQALSWAK
jgi:hypothetical protein